MTRPGRRTLALALLSIATLADRAATAGQVVTITTDAKGGFNQLVPVAVTFNGVAGSEYAGAFTTTVQGGQTIDAFCIDLYDATYLGSSWQANVAPIATFAGKTDIGAGDAPGGHGDAIGSLYSQYAANDADRIQAAALQVAIWKVEYDGTTSLSTGKFQFSDSADLTSDQHLVYRQVTADFRNFDPATASGRATLYAATSHPGGLYQDLVGPGGIGPNDVVAATPEPGTLATAFSGLAALALGSATARLRRRRSGRPTAR